MILADVLGRYNWICHAYCLMTPYVGNYMKKVLFSFLAAAVLFTTGCLSSDQWEGYVYPDKKNPLLCRSSGKVKSLEECKEKSMALLKRTGSLEKGYYVCGKNCTKQESFYQLKCEEKIRGNW